MINTQHKRRFTNFSMKGSFKFTENETERDSHFSFHQRKNSIKHWDPYSSKYVLKAGDARTPNRKLSQNIVW
jgi:hypothetical protein